MQNEPGPSEYDVDPPAAPEEPPAPPKQIGDDVLCAGCGYNLRGLAEDGRCPECRMEVWRSARRDELVVSSPDYLAKLSRGTVLVLISIAGQVATIVLSIITGILLSVTSNEQYLDTLQRTTEIVAGLFDIAGMLGWWWLSAPEANTISDPGDRPRAIVRLTVIVTAACGVLVLALSGFNSPSAGAFGGALELIAAIAWIGKFFAAMLYLRWLARRLPNPYVEARATKLMWLGPVLCTVGAACFLIGPLVALILYWSMINWVRIDLNRIREENARCFGAEPTGA